MIFKFYSTIIAILLWFVFVLFKLPWFVIHNSAPFLSCFSTSCLKIEEYFGALAVKIVDYEHLAVLFFIVFLVLSFCSSKCQPRGICLFIPHPLRFEAELDSQCRSWICVLKLRSLSRWCVVSLVICFEQQVVKEVVTVPCAATLSSMPARRLEKSREDWSHWATLVRRPDRDLVVLAFSNYSTGLETQGQPITVQTPHACSLIIGILEVFLFV